MERRVLLVVLLAIALGLTAYFCRPGPASVATEINRLNFARIHEGMTQAEVEDLLRVPPGNYAKSVTAVRNTRWGAPRDARLEEWWSDAGVIRVYFNKMNTVVTTEFLEVETADNSWVGRAWDWLTR
jgi:hypothetical protein